MATAGLPLWSTTAASNATADPAVNMAEGMAPSAVNDSVRALMASVAGWRNDLYGITTGGSSTAYTVATASTFATAAAMSGVIFTIIPHTTSGAAPTLAVDGLTARALNGSTGVAVPTGALISGKPYLVKYVHASTEFIVFGIGSVGAFTTLTASGAATLSSTLSVGGALSVTGDVAVNTNKFTVAAASGNTLVAGTLVVTGALTGSSTIAGTDITASGAISAATATGSVVAAQAGMETATSTTTLVAPGRQHFHPGHPKAWAAFTGSSGSILSSYNITSISDDSAGDWTVTIANDFSDTNYAVMFGVKETTNVPSCKILTTKTAGTFAIKAAIPSTNGDIDPEEVYFTCHGDI